jgi:protein tyrosine phosphatase (PTP) superfamily phosphohydrolase (DUF442 family)
MKGQPGGPEADCTEPGQMVLNGVKMKRSRFVQQAFALITLASLLGSMTPGVAAKPTGSGAAKIAISNFGKVNDHLYRGSQPEGSDYQDLAALGIKTIVDLRDDAKSSSRSLAEQAGMEYINLPLDDKKYPPADAAERFLEVANNPANWPVYIHCAGGRHRTGAMTAVYRMSVDGWDIDRAYQEMKDYDFYTRWGHGDYKDYVYNYYRDLHKQQAKI